MNKLLMAFAILVTTTLHRPLLADNDLGIKFAKSVPKTQRKLMDRDISLIKNLIVEDPDQSSTRLFNTPASGANYAAWLAQRARYVVDESFDVEKNVQLLRAGYAFPNATIPVIERGTARPDTGGTVVTVMSNLGAALYLAGKMQSNLLGVKIDGIGVVSVTSPRVGLFKIGQGHFMPLMRSQNDKNYDNMANSLARLSTFFHEARHSDGNALSLGFIHAVCPAAHDYAGYNACDRNANGPYTVGAAFLKSVLNRNCAGCSEGEKEMLRLTYMDAYSRVISSNQSSASTDDSLQATLRDTCNLLLRLGTKTTELPSACLNLNSANPGTSAPSAVDIWDATPEYGPAS